MSNALQMMISSFPLPRAFVLVMAAFLAIGAGSSTRAQNLSVSPPVATFEVNPGQQVTDTAAVTNSGPTPFQLNIYLSDWAFKPDGTIYYNDPGKSPQSACPWISYTPASSTLKGNSDLKARYTIQVPAGANPGTHWCVLFFDGGSAGPVSDKTIATVRLRVSETIYVNVAPLEQNGAITGMFTQPPQKVGQPYQLVVQYANSGNQVQWVTGKIELRDEQGNQARKLELKGFTALPGDTRNVTIKIPGPLKAGTYAALAVLDFGKKLTQVAGQTSFTLQQALPAPTPAGPTSSPPNGGQSTSPSKTSGGGQ